MSSETLTIKCRSRIGKLGVHGIKASRPTGSVGKNGEPDAFLVTNDGKGWLVKIWQGDTLHPQLFDDANTALTLENTLLKCEAWREDERLKLGSESTPNWLILAPALKEAADQCTEGQGISVLNKSQCSKPKKLAEAILATASDSVLTSDSLNEWRAAAVPETKIEQPPHVRRKVERAPATPIAPQLLDYKQERCTRLDLEPRNDLREMSEDLLVRVVTGVAGCGKTLVLLHRAALLAQHFPEARVLIISHNRPLIADLERRLSRRKGPRGNIQCVTFLQWLHSFAPPRGELLKSYQTIGWIESRLQSGGDPAIKNRSPEWVLDEISWMFDHGLVDESYLTKERKGRGTGLRESHRREMLALARDYRTYLREAGNSDWSEWPLSVWEERENLLEKAAGFDHLLIDEAQFFAPIWLDLLIQRLNPGGHLFLCADPTQGFLRRRMSWAQVGLSVRNRSHRLDRPYRSTREILNFAARFYRSRLPEDEEPLNLPSPEWLEAVEVGTPPTVLPGGSGEDQIQRLLTELRAFRNEGGELADVLLLIAGRKIKTISVVDRLNRELGENAAAEIKNDFFPDSSAGVSHLMAATGLERPIVFLLGIDELVEEEGNPGLGEDERQEIIRDHTRQIYVGLTRAMERLVIFSSKAATIQGT
ncbi:MAG: DUF2075 domain-containing protein [Verrucomicrobiales bacterium]|nr:DUF2075 domain-containing protein [Verrucomicrobiales bacterium]